MFGNLSSIRCQRICLSVTNFDLHYPRTDEIEWAKNYCLTISAIIVSSQILFTIPYHSFLISLKSLAVSYFSFLGNQDI